MAFVMRKNSIRFLLQVSFFTFTLANSIVQSSFAANFVAHVGISDDSQTPGSGSELFKTTAMVLIPAGGVHVSRAQAQRNFARFKDCEFNVRGLDAEAEEPSFAWCSVGNDDMSAAYDARNTPEWLACENKSLDCYKERADLQLALKRNILREIKPNNASSLVLQGILNVRCLKKNTIEEQAHSLSYQMSRNAVYVPARAGSSWYFNFDDNFNSNLKGDYRDMIDTQGKSQKALGLSYKSRATAWIYVSKIARVAKAAAIVIAGARAALYAGFGTKTSVGLGVAAAGASVVLNI